MKKSSFLIRIIVILLEIFVFNFSSINSMFYDEEKIDINTIEIKGMKESKDGYGYRIEKENNYIKININKKINNIYLDISTIKRRNLYVTFEYTDDANNKFGMIYNDKYTH